MTIAEKTDSVVRDVPKAETIVEKTDLADRIVIIAVKVAAIVSKAVMKVKTSAVVMKAKILADRLAEVRAVEVSVRDQEEMMQMQYLHQN